jgi:hypothetical protein
MRKYLLLLLLLLTQSLWAGQIELLATSKKYQKLVDYYLSHKSDNFSQNEYLYISHALRKTGHFREDISFNIRFLNKFHQKKHKQLLKDIRESNTVDPEEYTEEHKLVYWIILTDYANILKKYDERKPVLEKDYKHFQVFSKIIVHLEFRESKVDKVNNLVNNHLEYLTKKVYNYVSSFFFQYVSWQREVFLKGLNSKTGLNVTNRGYCVGADAGIENYKWHFYVDGCLMFGSGGVQNSSDPTVSYQQSNVGAYGLKAGPGASVIVSSSKSRVGIKLPLIYTIQKFSSPNNGQFSIEETNPLSIMTNVYSRFQFGKWYFQTEFGKYIQRDEFFWGLGIGKEF